MPNDLNGNALKVGDKVKIPGTVVTLSDDVNYVNCTVELDAPLPPTGARITQSYNSQQVEKVIFPDAGTPAPAPTSPTYRSY